MWGIRKIHDNSADDTIGWIRAESITWLNHSVNCPYQPKQVRVATKAEIEIHTLQP